MTATFCRITSCERWEVSIDFNARCAGFNLISGTLVGLELEEEEEMVEEACPKDLESDLPSFLYIVVLWLYLFSVVVVVLFQFSSFEFCRISQGALLGVLESKEKIQ